MAHPRTLSLVEDNGFYQRFVKSRTDPVRHLVEIQQSIEKPIVIVPLVMFFSKFPDRSTSSILDMMFGTEINPGRIRRLVTLFKNPGKLFVEVSEPLDLRWFLNQSDHQGKSVDALSLLLAKAVALANQPAPGQHHRPCPEISRRIQGIHSDP